MVLLMATLYAINIDREIWRRYTYICTYMTFCCGYSYDPLLNVIFGENQISQWFSACCSAFELFWICWRNLSTQPSKPKVSGVQFATWQGNVGETMPLPNDSSPRVEGTPANQQGSLLQAEETVLCRSWSERCSIGLGRITNNNISLRTFQKKHHYDYDPKWCTQLVFFAKSMNVFPLVLIQQVAPRLCHHKYSCFFSEVKTISDCTRPWRPTWSYLTIWLLRWKPWSQSLQSRNLAVQCQEHPPFQRERDQQTHHAGNGMLVWVSCRNRKNPGKLGQRRCPYKQTLFIVFLFLGSLTTFDARWEIILIFVAFWPVVQPSKWHKMTMVSYFRKASGMQNRCHQHNLWSHLWSLPFQLYQIHLRRVQNGVKIARFVA